MHYSFRSFRVDFARFVVLVSLIGTLLLSGCALGTASFPDTPEPQTQVPLGTIQGNNYGGHAPIVGAHLFVLQAGTGGYGSKVASLLSANETTTDYYGSVYTTALDSTAGSPTYGMYYITTDNRGDFALSGDYTCTAGLPVYLYASGGNPATNPAVTITSAAAVPGTTVDSTTHAYDNYSLITFQNSGTNLIYQGEQIQFNGITGAFADFNVSYSPTTSYTVVSAGLPSQYALTTSQFTILLPIANTGGSGITVPSTSTGSGATAFQSGSTAPNNPAIVNVALLGNCPGSITFAGIPDGTSTNTLTGVSPADLSQLAVGNVVLGPGIYNATITGINSSTGTITFNQNDTGGNPAGPYYTYVSTSSAANNFSYLNFVYMNEVSTAAAMTALAPFADTTVNNDALHIGTSSTNLAGLQHAVLNAANLYDIQGSQVGVGGDGDTHIAYATTPSNSGGTVPQKLLNTLGNLLANCVDSANTYNAATASGGTQSTQCAALMNNATSDGTTTGTKPNDTATAMLNIAHHPAGEPSGNTTFVSGLFNSITGNVPFQPYLSSAPNDFSVGISYTGSGLNAPTGVAIDASGDAWITGTSAVVKLGPAGSVLSGSSGYATVSGQSGRGPAIDGGGNLWFAQNNSVEFKMSNSGTLTSGTSGYSTGSTNCPNPPTPVNTAIDGSGNAWVTNYYGDYQGETVTELSPAGAIQQEINTYANSGCPTNGAGSTAATVRNPYGIALDGSGNMWISSQSSENAAAIPTSTTTGAYTAYNNSNSAITVSGTRNLAIDQSGQVWLPDYYSAAQVAGAGTSIVMFAPSTATASGTAHADNVSYTQYTGGGLLGPDAIAVDGANNIWVSGPNDYVSEFSNSGTALTPPTTCSTSPCTSGGYAGGFTAAGGLGLAIDGSGSVWVTEPSANAVIQMIGVATPVVTPMVTAAKTGTPAAKP